MKKNTIILGDMLGTRQTFKKITYQKLVKLLT